MKKDSEQEFIDWLDSIEFVEQDGSVLPTELTSDQSDDPDNDREILEPSTKTKGETK